MGNISPKNGFTLIEMSVVLLIIGILASGLLLGLNAQRGLAENQEARQQLDILRDSLLGFAITQGRLPCPAAPNLAFNNSSAGSEDCSRQHGVIPWVTLALPETDPWGQRFTYYASNRFTTAGDNGTPGFAIDTEGNANIYDGTSKTIASNLPIVVVCHGRQGNGAWLSDGSQHAAATGDEAENADTDLSFIARPLNDSFDDQLIWLPPSLLKARMVSAGRLP